MIKYLELDSSYRNRQRNPSQAMFEVYYDRTIEDVDPVSESAPTQSWQGNTASINGTVVSSTRDTIVFTSVGTPQDDPNYYVNTILSPPGTRILSYKYLGSNTAEVTVEDMQLALTTGTVITVSDPTDLALLRVFVPDTPIDLRNYYVGYYLYDETLNLYAKIVASESGVVTVDNAIPGWAVTDSFSIRSQLPATSGGTTGAASHCPRSRESTVAPSECSYD